MLEGSELEGVQARAQGVLVATFCCLESREWMLVAVPVTPRVAGSRSAGHWLAVTDSGLGCGCRWPFPPLRQTSAGDADLPLPAAACSWSRAVAVMPIAQRPSPFRSSWPAFSKRVSAVCVRSIL